MKDTKKNFQDLISGLVIMIIAAFFYWTTIGTKSFLGSGKGSTAPDTIPKAVAVAMFVLGALIIVRWFIQMKRGKLTAPTQEDDSENCVDMTQEQIAKRQLFQKITMPITLVLVFLFIFGLEHIGFIFSAAIFLTLQITLLSTDLSARSWLKALLIAVIATLVIFVIFGCAFNLAIPKVSFLDNSIYSLFRSIFG